MYFIVGKVDGSNEEKNRNKCLNVASTDKNKNELEKYTEFWDGIKTFIERVNDKPGECRKDFMKIKFNSDDNLSLNKILKLHNLTVTVRSAFEGDGKYYPQGYLDECLYEL